MADDTGVPKPFTLWFETLPTSDTARLLVWPRADQVRVVFFWNHEFHSQRSFATLEAAESWGYDFHRAIQQDKSWPVRSSPHHPSASYDAAPRKGARATGTKRPAIAAHAATGRADAPEHGHAPGPAAGSSGGRVPPVGAGKHTRTAS